MPCRRSYAGGASKMYTLLWVATGQGDMASVLSFREDLMYISYQAACATGSPRR